MKNTLQQHLFALNQVFARLKQQRSSTLLMCLVIGVTLSLPGVMYIVVDNIRQLASQMQNEPRISVFLRLDIAPKQKQAIEERLAHHPKIERFHYVSRDTAWHQMLQDPSTAAVASNLAKNPLPDAFFVSPKTNTPEALAPLQQELQALEGVELAQMDTHWIKRLHALLTLGEKAIWVLSALLGFALLTIIGNSIRLQILTQREEIEVSQLIGATDRFIRRPFLYAGMVYGIGGGLAAIALVCTIISVFNHSVSEIAELYASDFSLSLPNGTLWLGLLLVASTLGLISAYAAVQRALAKL